MRRVSFAPKTRVEASAVIPLAMRKLRRVIMMRWILLQVFGRCYQLSPGVQAGISALASSLARFGPHRVYALEEYAHPNLDIGSVHGLGCGRPSAVWPAAGPVAKCRSARYRPGKTTRYGNVGTRAQSGYSGLGVRRGPVGRDHPVRWQESRRVGLSQGPVHARKVDR